MLPECLWYFYRPEYWLHFWLVWTEIFVNCEVLKPRLLTLNLESRYNSCDSIGSAMLLPWLDRRTLICCESEFKVEWLMEGSFCPHQLRNGEELTNGTTLLQNTAMTLVTCCCAASVLLCIYCRNPCGTPLVKPSPLCLVRAVLVCCWVVNMLVSLLPSSAWLVTRQGLPSGLFAWSNCSFLS